MLGVLGACGAPPRSAEPDGPERLGEAHRLALEAQRAERAGQPDKAIELYRRSLAESGDFFYVWNNLGVLLMNRQEYMEAVRMFQTAADVAPTDSRPYENIGLVYHTLGYDEKAMEYYDLALVRNPTSIDALRGSVRTAKRLGIADDKSLERVRTALMIERDPDWRRVFETEQVRLAGQLREKRRE